jgi:hypothetical protein
MIGLATYAATKRSLLGFDWKTLASAAGGALSAAGGAQGGGGDAAAAKAKAEAEKAAAEKSANTWKLIGVIGIVVIIGGVFLLKPKAQPAK